MTGGPASNAFTAMIEGPLRTVAADCAGSKALIVIDGVDEMPERERVMLLSLDWTSLSPFAYVLFLGREAGLSRLRGRAVWVDLQRRGAVAASSNAVCWLQARDLLS